MVIIPIKRGDIIMINETFLQNEKTQELAKLLAQNCESLSNVQNLLKDLFKGTLEEMLESEMDEHLGYDKHSSEGINSGNSRNGYNKKTLQSEYGEVPISVPRDRNGAFSPKLIGKYQTKTDDLENRIIAMYAKGMSNRDIEDHLGCQGGCQGDDVKGMSRGRGCCHLI